MVAGALRPRDAHEMQVLSVMCCDCWFLMPLKHPPTHTPCQTGIIKGPCGVLLCPVLATLVSSKLFGLGPFFGNAAEAIESSTLSS